MDKGRPSRSRTGCQSCRRRKVRCDERKPICRACERLSLTCAYGYGGPGAPASSRYRVRFVSSPYSRPASVGKESKPARSAPPERSHEATSDSVGDESELPEDNVDGSYSQEVDNRSFGAVLRQHPPRVGPTASSSQDVLAPPQTAAQEPSPYAQVTQMMAHEVHVNAGDVPSFFDLNMNFDMLSEEWLTSPQTPGDTSISPSASRHADFFDANASESNVIIGPEDHSLIQHYLNVMTGYTKIRGSGDENIYSQIFSNMALFHAPLYNAIMAWTALHLGQSSSEAVMTQKAEERYAYAISLIHRDQNVAHHLELSLVTIWFALQYELLAAQGIESFVRHLEFAADLVDAHRRHQKAGGQASPLGHIGSRVLVWLGSYDARASWIGGSGRLLQNLELFSAGYDFLTTAFPDVPAGASFADLKPYLQISLEIDIAENRIVQLYRRENAAPVAIWSALQFDLLSIQERLENDAAVAPFVNGMPHLGRSPVGKITTRRFNSLLLLSSIYSVIITFHRMLPAAVAMSLPNKLITAEVAAIRIIRASSWVCRARSPSPQNIWPRILFMAGIETTDLVYQDWVLKTLADAEHWGVNYGKTRILLEHVLNTQRKQGARVDYLDVMKQSTGLFII